MEPLIWFAISFLIGLLLGIERERSHPEGTQAIGVRTLILFSLLGTMAATIDNPAVTVPLCFLAVGIILLSYFRSTENVKRRIDIGITTELAAGIVFALGYMVPSFPLTAITVSAVILLVLMERKRLHFFSRKTLKPQEIETIIILMIFALGVIPVLPNRTIDPWQFFNPRNFAILITLIASMQFAGYLAIRLFGQNMGQAILGFLGGLVSSTAVFATLGDVLKESRFAMATMASALFAVIAMLIELVVILLVAAPGLLVFIAWPLFTMIIVSLTIALLLLRYSKNSQRSPSVTLVPLNYNSIFRSAALIMLILFFIAIIKRYSSITGIFYAAFLAGLFEFHGISFAAALFYLENQLNIHQAASMLALALLASFVSKFILLWGLTPRHFAFWLTLFLLVILASGGIVYWVAV
ncbi:MgtC/SapB family protein [Aquicella lusitana]|uniref:Uncharacterized membrane protein (DUF4010 family) n=1 Tax=Aquicella lusitana TaxID=254246 RepID=A0A370GN86_9COXI|nr:MgtC/SapB family protein [Aquicella lusitana]RDI43383.1 uncharacterized membrane protein (DUF4010 family) [Aquicella lusitana]VVC73533.1 hypothetical protein AQULUS_12760 [Aquicella lusitana]